MTAVVTHVVWDWNGTLLDDLHCCIDVTNTLLIEYGLPVLDGVADYQRIFRFPVAEYYADLGFDTRPGGNFGTASVRYLELYHAAAVRCELHAGAKETLRRLHASGVRQVVISASEQQNLLKQLSPFQLNGWLDGAHGIADIYAASKLSIAQRWLATTGADPAEVVFVGDSQHDYEIATAVGARCVLFSGGHHSRTQLETLDAPVVDDLFQVAAHVR
ncbi:MAG TPA: HAD hydrolase-like protein [Propionicimonas sp.]|nr:HAD hydrolase-like protein [Propionicimonas sp.]HRA05890.1 HAD hydrolase-like protein [Propionicimonas sp.]